MARLVCPRCKTVHQVSVLQSSYRRLTCKRCGQSMPLALARPTSGPRAAEVSSAVPAEEARDLRTQKWEDSAIAAFSTDLAWRLCPRCGANIRREAIKCRACKEFLPAARVPLVPLVPPQAAPEPAPAQKVQPSRLTRAALAVLVVAAVVLLLMWLRSDRIRPAPGSSVGQGAGGMA